jgi:hypothetical protein
MEPIDCPETSLTSYQPTPHNVVEERTLQAYNKFPSCWPKYGIFVIVCLIWNKIFYTCIAERHLWAALIFKSIGLAWVLFDSRLLSSLEDWKKPYGNFSELRFEPCAFQIIRATPVRSSNFTCWKSPPRTLFSGPWKAVVPSLFSCELWLPAWFYWPQRLRCGIFFSIR